VVELIDRQSTSSVMVLDRAKLVSAFAMAASLVAIIGAIREGRRLDGTACTDCQRALLQLRERDFGRYGGRSFTWTSQGDGVVEANQRIC